MQQISHWSAMPQRRREDAALAWLQDTDSRARASLARLARETTDPRAWLAPAADAASPGADIRAIGPADAVLPDAWVRLWKRAQLPEQLIAFQDELAAARSEAETCDVVARHAARIVGAYQSLVLLPETPPEAGERTLRIAGWWSNGAAPRDLALDEKAVRGGPRLLDAGAADAPFGLAPLAATPGVATLALVPIGEVGLLCLSERRAERIFTQDDWAVLDSLASQGARALEQVRSLEEARSQALVDPLTGLANRRHMEVVLQHAWAAAERGDGLAVMLLDLDDFKGINDRYGHAVGDDVLRVVSEVLRTEVRGSDAAVRYGGDEFLVILPRAGAEAARALYERIHRRLQGWVGVTAGIAAFHSSHASAHALVQAADADLYARKHARPPARELPVM